MCMYIYVCMYVYICMCVCLYVCVCVCVYQVLITKLQRVTRTRVLKGSKDEVRAWVEKQRICTEDRKTMPAFEPMPPALKQGAKAALDDEKHKFFVWVAKKLKEGKETYESANGMIRSLLPAPRQDLIDLFAVWSAPTAKPQALGAQMMFGARPSDPDSAYISKLMSSGDYRKGSLEKCVTRLLEVRFLSFRSCGTRT